MTKRGPKRGRRVEVLSEQQLAFVRAVLEGLTYTEAARRAGYSGSDDALATSGSRVARKPHVAQEIARQRAILDGKSNMTREARLAIAEQMILDPKLDARERLKALELRAKMGGDFIERRQIENTGPAGGPVQIEVKLTTERAIALARKAIEDGQPKQPTASTEATVGGTAATVVPAEPERPADVAR